MVRLARPTTSATAARVTAVVPCYNYGRYLPQVVASVLDQPRVHARVLIVDDASTDESLAVARELAERDDRVAVIAHKENQGHIATYNDGLAAVDTEYVTLVSADDLVAPGALSRATDLMQAHTTVGLVYGITRSFCDRPPDVTDRLWSWTIWPGRQWLKASCRLGRNFIMSPEVVLRTDAVRGVGGYDETLPHSADLAYWLRVAVDWDVGRVNGCVQAFYRVHASNMHLTTFATMPVDLQHRRAAFETLRQTWASPRLEAPDQLVRLACRAMAREARRLARRDLDSGRAPDMAEELVAFAGETDPTGVRRRFSKEMVHRIAAARRGETPSLSARARELVRLQADRVRWRVLNSAGLS